MKKGYHIDWQTNTVTITKKFAEEANEFNSDAYNKIQAMRGQGFHIAVREQKPRNACPTRITFKQMETILSCMDCPDERLAQLHAVMDAGKGQKNQYEYVRKWFLENYPHFNQIPVLNSNNQIVAPRVTLALETTKTLELAA